MINNLSSKEIQSNFNLITLLNFSCLNSIKNKVIRFVFTVNPLLLRLFKPPFRSPEGGRLAPRLRSFVIGRDAINRVSTFAPSPLRAFAPSPLRPFVLSCLRAFAPSRLCASLCPLCLCAKINIKH